MVRQENNVTAHYCDYDGCFYYVCPNCGLEQNMTDLTNKEEHELELGEPVYYQCDTCEEIAKVVKVN